MTIEQTNWQQARLLHKGGTAMLISYNNKVLTQQRPLLSDTRSVLIDVNERLRTYSLYQKGESA